MPALRRKRETGLFCASLLVATLSESAFGQEATPHSGNGAAESLSDDDFALPPVPVDELRARAPQPSWDTGLLIGACGTGTSRLWQDTQLCMGAMADVLWGRRTEDLPGVGGYAQLSTQGFQDGRLSLGTSGILSLVEWFTLGGRLGALAVASPRGLAPGMEGFIELGHRSVSFDARYSISHTLFGGLQWTSRDSEAGTAGTALWFGIRVDGYWLTTPAVLFR